MSSNSFDSDIKLSVVVPAYNAEATLERCLDSIQKSSILPFELIIVDDGSSDETGNIAKKYTEYVLIHSENKGRCDARRTGFEAASGDIIVNIDSDVTIDSSALQQVLEFFHAHPEYVALTGKVKKEESAKGFFTCYKNLYMHYRFKDLPQDVTFLYGSFFAFKKEFKKRYLPKDYIADDTYFGQQIHFEGQRIAFIKHIEVSHTKKFTFFSLLKNDFLISRDWARIFLKFRGLRQMGQNQNRFAHAEITQILSIVLVGVSLLLLLWQPTIGVLASGMGIGLLNLRFLKYLSGEKGVFFSVKAYFFITFDYFVRGAGVLGGFVRFMLRRGNEA